MVIQLDLLKKVDYFANLSLDELNSIKKFISEQRVDEGETFLTEGARSNFVYFIISGVVNVHKALGDEKEQILNIATTGESLNDVSAFDGNPTAANALAMTPVILYRVRKKDLKVILEKHPQVKPRLITRFEPWHLLAFGRFAQYQLFIYRRAGIRDAEIRTAVQEVKAEGQGDGATWR